MTTPRLVGLLAALSATSTTATALDPRLVPAADVVGTVIHLVLLHRVAT